MKAWKTALSSASSAPTSSASSSNGTNKSSLSARSSVDIGLASTSLQLLPPLRFHSRHGENIQLSADSSEARRVRSYCKGIVFSDRPIGKTEMVCFRITDQSYPLSTGPSPAAQWSGSLRIGITTHNPDTVDLTRALYLCPDLTSRSGFWARPLPDICCTEKGESEKVIHFQCLPDGQTITFGVNGVTKGVAFEKVDTTRPLWAVFDVYGSTLAVQLLDSSIFLRPANQARSQSSISPLSVLMALKNRHTSLASNNPVPTVVPPEPHRPTLLATPVTTPSTEMRSLPWTAPTPSTVPAPPIYPTDPPHVRHRARHFPHLQLRGLKFYKHLTGRNVVISEEGRCARLMNGEFCSGYVFTPRPVAIDETVVVRIVENDWDFDGGLAFGLTTCDPVTLCQASLPDDSDQLLDRAEYWVVAKDVASKPKEGQELAFTMRADGTVQISRNNGKPSDFLFIDQSQTFWMFFDLYGTTRKLLLLGSCMTPHPSEAKTQSTANHASTSRTDPVSPRRTAPARPPPPVIPPIPLTVDLSPRQPVSLPLPRHSTSSTPRRSNNDLIDLNVDLPPSNPSTPRGPLPPPQTVARREETVPFPTIPGTIAPGFQPRSECVVCFEEESLAVLYTCGHQVMCYKCAQGEFRRGKPCPICQKPIKDVIKTFRG